MDRTESDRALAYVPSRSPVLRHLFRNGEILPTAPVVALPPGTTLIGREVADRQGLRLTQDGRASREHAAIEVTARAGDATVLLRDLQSKNGTYRNGERCAEATLSDGDLLRIGSSLLLLRHEPARSPDVEIASLCGVSEPMRTLRRQIARLAPAPAPVLLLGESGTGKELSARALHAYGGRRGPLVPVNCSAIPESLAESLLFGHAVGSFTGASAGHDGVFRAAHGGTLFLDEVGELPASVQPKLLRALEEGSITPIGSTRPISVDVRIIAATHRKLGQDSLAGTFRADLYARLSALIVELPPLRVRREDILLLLAAQWEGTMRPMTVALAEALVLHPFPLNVRELRQLATHMRYALDGEGPMDVSMLSDRLKTAGATPQAASASVQEKPHAPNLPLISDAAPPKPLPQEEVERLLRQHHGVVARVAAAVGRSPRQIRRWMELYNLDRSKL